MFSDWFSLWPLSLLMLVYFTQRLLLIAVTWVLNSFFFISGFLMAKKANNTPYKENSLGSSAFNFIRSKYMQIFYNLIVAIACSFVLQALIYHWDVRQIIRQFVFVIPELLCLQMTGFDNLFFATGVAWYLSAMLMVMWFLFPLLLKYKHNISCIVAPLLVCFLYGYMWHMYGHLADPGEWLNNMVHKGILRAIAGICMGIISYEVCSAMQKKVFSVAHRVLITIVEYGCWIVAVGGMYFYPVPSYYDFYIAGALFVAITLCFSNQSYITSWINRYNCSFFRNASVCLYFNNFYISSIVSNTITGHTKTQMLAIYLVLVFAMATVNYFAANGLRRIVSKCFAAKA